MTASNLPGGNFDMDALYSLVDRIVAANLTTAIYARLHTIQSREDYDAATFDDVARSVVREVMHTYSALLSVFKGTHEHQAESENGP